MFIVRVFLTFVNVIVNVNVNCQGVWVFLTFVCKKNVLKVKKKKLRPQHHL